jgi:hypothetical protein
MEEQEDAARTPRPTQNTQVELHPSLSLATLQPIINLKAPRRVGLCDGLTLDTSLSRNDGGRAFTTYQWHIQATTTTNDSPLNISRNLTALLHASEAVVTIRKRQFTCTGVGVCSHFGFTLCVLLLLFVVVCCCCLLLFVVVVCCCCLLLFVVLALCIDLSTDTVTPLS